MEAILKDITRLEEQLKNLNPHSKIHCTVTANSVGELAALSQSKRFKKLKVFSPFEISPDKDFFFFEYSLEDRPHITLTIKANQEEPHSK